MKAGLIAAILALGLALSPSRAETPAPDYDAMRTQIAEMRDALDGIEAQANRLRNILRRHIRNIERQIQQQKRMREFLA